MVLGSVALIWRDGIAGTGRRRRRRRRRWRGGRRGRGGGGLTEKKGDTNQLGPGLSAHVIPRKPTCQRGRAQHAARYRLQPGLDHQPCEPVLPGEELEQGLAPDAVAIEVKLELPGDQSFAVRSLHDCKVGLGLACRVQVDPAKENRLGRPGPRLAHDRSGGQGGLV